ncbi:MAG: ABC transporter permease [Terrisporobacter sp.]
MIWLLVAKNEFKRSLKNKKKLILTLLLPLISIVAAIGVNSFMKPSISIGVIENEYTNRAIEEVFNEVDGVKLIKANEETINTDMILAKYIGVVKFKEDNTFDVYCLDKNIKATLKDCISETTNSGKTERIKNLISTIKEENLSIAQRSNGFIFITLIITCTMSATVLLKDKDDGILKRYSTAPNNLYSYILGNYVYNTVNTITQVLISALLLYLLRIDIGISIYQFIFIGFIMSVMASSIATFITVISKGELQASLLASSIALIIALFGGSFLPIEKMPEVLKFISNISITKWILELTYFIEKGIYYEGSLFIVVGIIVLSMITIYASIKIGKKKLC